MRGDPRWPRDIGPGAVLDSPDGSSPGLDLDWNNYSQARGLGMGHESTGTVTFLFTDIEGSAQRWQLDDHAMAAASAQWRRERSGSR